MVERTRKLSVHASKEVNGDVSHSDTGGVSPNRDILELVPATPLNEPESNEQIYPVVMANAEPSREVKPSPPTARPIVRQQASDDQFLTMLAIGLIVALAALLFRKFSHSFSWISFK